MTKNENNSHAFLRKMVENIKQTKDAQSPDDAKANEVTRARTDTRTHTSKKNCGNSLEMKVLHLFGPHHSSVRHHHCHTDLLHVCFMMFHLQKLYIVCDVALFVMANKSTACHLDSPKDPVLPSKFFLVQDKARRCTLTH